MKVLLSQYLSVVLKSECHRCIWALILNVNERRFRCEFFARFQIGGVLCPSRGLRFIVTFGGCATFVCLAKISQARCVHIGEGVFQELSFVVKFGCQSMWVRSPLINAKSSY